MKQNKHSNKFWRSKMVQYYKKVESLGETPVLGRRSKKTGRILFSKENKMIFQTAWQEARRRKYEFGISKRLADYISETEVFNFNYRNAQLIRKKMRIDKGIKMGINDVRKMRHEEVKDLFSEDIKEYAKERKESLLKTGNSTIEANRIISKEVANLYYGS